MMINTFSKLIDQGYVREETSQLTKNSLHPCLRELYKTNRAFTRKVPDIQTGEAYTMLMKKPHDLCHT